MAPVFTSARAGVALSARASVRQTAASTAGRGGRRRDLEASHRNILLTASCIVPISSSVRKRPTSRPVGALTPTRLSFSTYLTVRYAI